MVGCIKTCTNKYLAPAEASERGRHPDANVPLGAGRAEGGRHRRRAQKVATHQVRFADPILGDLNMVKMDPMVILTHFNC